MIRIDAAIGVLAEAGRVLVARRPEGTVCAGKWEFPGGKIEAGETPRVALGREMREELGIEVLGARHLVNHLNRFPDRHVYLDVWMVSRWSGEPEGREGQPLRWVEPEEVLSMDFLPGAGVILPALREAMAGV